MILGLEDQAELLQLASKICSIPRSNRFAILKASGKLGSYLPRSGALIVWRETPSRSAKSPYDHPLSARSCGNEFFTGTAPACLPASQGLRRPTNRRIAVRYCR